mgnify:CR=1 FL=1
MSEQPKEKRDVPDGKSRFMKTTRKKPSKTGFIGYEAIWEPFHKEVEYTTPKNLLCNRQLRLVCRNASNTQFWTARF